MIKRYISNIGTRSVPTTIDLTTISWNDGLLIRSTNWLGDAVMMLPATYKLRTLLPRSFNIHLLCPTKLVAFWEQIPWIDRVYGFQGKRLNSSCIKKLAGFRPGATVIFPNSFGSAWDIARMQFPSRIGRSGRGRSILLHQRLPPWKRRAGEDIFHESKKYLEIATSCGYQGWDNSNPAIIIKSSCWKKSFGSRDRFLSTQYLAIAPGAAYGPAKQWSVDYFRSVAKWWSKYHGKVLGVGTSAERVLVEQSLKDSPDSWNLAGETTLDQLMFILSHVACVVSNDSGVMHLAGALQAKGIAIFGSTDPIATGPVGGLWIVLQKKLSCSPCLRRECLYKHKPYECLKSITPKMVIENLQYLLEG